jgi:hypoxanthine phosphoribosyltransferase
MVHAAPAPRSALRVLITRQQIEARVRELAAEISRDFDEQSVVLVGVLKGAAVFLADLARSLELDATFDFIAVSSYGATSKSSGVVRLLKDVTDDLSGKNVVLVEDIVDTGLTLNYLRGLLADRGPRALRIAALLDKPSRRLMTIEADYTGFKIPDEFVVGYGLDFDERYRNLPDICVLTDAEKK